MPHERANRLVFSASQASLRGVRANQLKTRSRLAQDSTSRLKDAVKTHRNALQARRKRVSSESQASLLGVRAV